MRLSWLLPRLARVRSSSETSCRYCLWYSGRFHVRAQKCANKRPRSTKSIRNLQQNHLLIRLHYHHTICCSITFYTARSTSLLTYSCNSQSILSVNVINLRHIRTHHNSTNKINVCKMRQRFMLELKLSNITIFVIIFIWHASCHRAVVRDTLIIHDYTLRR